MPLCGYVPHLTENIDSVLPGGSSTNTIGAITAGSSVYFQVCGASTDAVVFEYRTKGSSGWSTIGGAPSSTSTGVWKSAPWSKGNPGYEQRVTVNGVALPTTDETKALATGALTAAKCRSPGDAGYPMYEGVGFNLYKLPATAGYTSGASASSTKKYIAACTAAGLLPVGCGEGNYHCNTNRFQGSPCVEVPASWSCNMLDSLHSHTGWTDIVTFLSDNRDSKDRLYAYLSSAGTHGEPSMSNVLSPVCGITGTSMGV